MTDTTIEQELAGLERRYWQALRDRDTGAALELTADPAILAGAQGVGLLTHDTFVAMMENATWTIDAFEIVGDLEVRQVADDTAIVAYTVHEEVTVDGQQVGFDAAETSTWVRRDGRWICVAHTESIAGDPFGRDRSR
jgi:hypothetical protein